MHGCLYDRIKILKGELILNEYPVLDARYEDGTRPRTYRILRLVLIEKYGICYWCSILVKEYPNLVFLKLKQGGAIPDDFATIDHLVARPFRKLGEVVGKVLACHKCNTKRSRKQDREAAKFYAKIKDAVGA